MDAETGITMTGDVMGTLRYMSPEQAAGRQARIDERTDIYSLGVTLYEVLALRPAFTSENRSELLWQIENQRPTRLRKLDAGIPADLETIIVKAIEKEPARRYETANALARDIQFFLADQPVEARPPSTSGVAFSRVRPMASEPPNEPSTMPP